MNEVDLSSERPTVVPQGNCIEEKNKSLIRDMAENYGLSPAVFQRVIKETIMPGQGNYTQAQFAAFLLIAKKYNLNPLTKEIYAYPIGGGIQTIISIDGWVKMINNHPQYDGVEFIDNIDDMDEMISIECKIYRKDRSRPISATEYMNECNKKTVTWNKWPRRMLRHKALIQAARYAFGFSGAVDPDEAERMQINNQNVKKINPLELEIEEVNEDEIEEIKHSGDLKEEEEISQEKNEQFEIFLESVKENILAECELPNATTEAIKKEIERQNDIGRSLAKDNDDIMKLARIINNAHRFQRGEMPLDALKRIFE